MVTYGPLGISLHQGLATKDRLWLLGHSGKVLRLDHSGWGGTVVADHAKHLLRDGTHLWALIKKKGETPYIQDLAAAKASRIALPRDGDPILLFRTPNGPGVLYAHMALIPSEEGYRRQPLSQPASDGYTASDLIGDYLYLGGDHGEFGGSVRRVNLMTGDTEAIALKHPADCHADDISRCLPVINIFPDPDQPDCILVGSNQTHLGLFDAAVHRVCGTRAELVFRKPSRQTANRGTETAWAFDYLQPMATGWVAAGQGWYAHSTGSGHRFAAIPALHPTGVLRLSKAQDGVVFVESACCFGPRGTERYIMPIALTD